jgi:hypothetical protein
MLLYVTLLQAFVHAFLLDYDGYTLDFNCDLHSAVRFNYYIDQPANHTKRPPSFTFDPKYFEPN